MREDVVASELFDEVDRRAEPDRPGNIWGAGLETVRRFLVLGLVESDVKDHLAAALPGRHRDEQIVAAIEHANPGRSVNLMPGQGVEVAAERLYIDWQSRRCLAPVDEHLGAP